MSFTYILGTIHLITYMLARVGTLHQIWVIRKSKKSDRENKQEKHTAQLSLAYRANVAFYVIFTILWVLTLEKIDWMITTSRSFSLILVLIILWEMWHDRSDKKAKYLLLGCLAVIVTSIFGIIYNFEKIQNFNAFFGGLTVFFAFTLLGGYVDKTYQIIKAKSRGKQSLPELLFQSIKDISGILYGLFIGFDMMWAFIVASLLTTAFRMVNIAVYLYYDRKETKTTVQRY